MPRRRASVERRERDKLKRSEHRRAERVRFLSLARQVAITTPQYPLETQEQAEAAAQPKKVESQPSPAENPVTVTQVAPFKPATRADPDWEDCLQIDGYEFAEDLLA